MEVYVVKRRSRFGVRAMGNFNRTVTRVNESADEPSSLQHTNTVELTTLINSAKQIVKKLTLRKLENFVINLNFIHSDVIAYSYFSIIELINVDF